MAKRKRYQESIGYMSVRELIEFCKDNNVDLDNSDFEIEEHGYGGGCFISLSYYKKK